MPLLHLNYPTLNPSGPQKSEINGILHFVMTPILFIVFVAIHFFASLFMHSFYLHRYGTHQQFSMNRFWEKTFFVLTFLFQGSAFLDPKSYAIMHLEHHAHSDTPDDPHSPLNFSKSKWGLDAATALPRMMWHTKKVFEEINRGRSKVIEFYRDRRFITWGEFEKFTTSKTVSISMGVLYGILYLTFAPVWWCWFFFPLTILSGPIQGAIVNWCGHMWGYRNYKLNDNSKNTWVLSTIMLGELFQNNHHQYPNSPNFAKKWFEIDPIYFIIWFFDKLHIIRLNRGL